MKRLALVLFSAVVLQSVHGGAWAQENAGFALERYEPTGAGQWSFMVDHPWYTRSKYFAAAGMTLDYSHNALLLLTRDASGHVTQTSQVIEHQLVHHLDVGFSFLDQFTINLSVPLVLYEGGTPAMGVAPLSGAAIGDPRLGVMVRLWHQPLQDALSFHVGLDFWIPIDAARNHAGDSNVRFMPKLVAAGLSHRILWSFLAGFQYRPDASLGMLAAGSGNTVGSELKFGAAIGYADVLRRFSVGPELFASTVVTGPVALQRSTSSLELLLGGHYNIVGQIETGLALGVGLLTEPGTPDFRMIFRIAYAPMRPEPPAPPPGDRDGDGILDDRDACPDDRGPASSIRCQNGCPVSDRDHDGIDDPHDRCPDVPMGAHPDPDQLGCPLKDTDGDGVFDKDDLCPNEAAGPHPRPSRRGCPDTDKDGDGVYDSVDQCPDIPAGLHPAPNEPGCPSPDRDNDGVPDVVDACPDKPGAPSPDPKKNGCPGLIEIKNGKLVILKPVFFATSKDVILPQSFPVLQAVADALQAQPEIKRLSIEGHTDNRGKPDLNLDLSDRRAKSVLRFLVERGVAADRLEAHGFGQTKPISTNKTDAGRAENRRVEFRIVSGSAGDAPAPEQP